MSQEALNQQGILLAKDPVVQEVFPPPDVSALTPLHAVPCVWPAERASPLMHLLFAFLFVPAEIMCTAVIQSWS